MTAGSAAPGSAAGEHAEILAALRDAVSSGADLAREAFDRRAFEVRLKPDGTPVTSADVEVERRILDLLSDRLPGIPITGEEKTGEIEAAPRAYIAIDPIDGTSNFMRGVPFFGVTAAFIEDGSPAVGVVADPAHHHLFWATREGGAYRDGERLPRLRERTGLRGATVAMSAESLPASLRGAFLLELLRRVDRQQAIRSVALEITGLAFEWVDAAIFSDISVWDFAAAALILEEAGGCWTTFAGTRPALTEPRARHSFVGAAGPGLHAEILALMRDTSSPAR